MKSIYTLLFLWIPFLGFSEQENIINPIDENESLDCIDESLIDPNAFCFEIYDPVCGCNNIIYSNSCIAESNGVISWVGGECSSSDVFGCTDATASNYNPDATIDDGSCDLCIDESLIDPNAFCFEIYDPVCGCNDVTYSNSCIAESNGVISWVGGECSSSDVFGCTDATAANYNSNATIDDGSCLVCEEPAIVNFNINAAYVVSEEYDNVLVNGNWSTSGDSNQYWNAWGLTLADDDMDGVYTGSLVVEPGEYEYVHVLSGSADGWSGWGIIGFAPEDCALGTNPISGDDAPNYYFDAQCGQVIDLPTICFGECSDCDSGGLGCTDETAGNYDPNASIDDGSCVVCEEPAVINFNVDASYLVSADYDNVLINGSWDAYGDSNQYWGAWGVTLTDEDMDGIYSGSLELGDPGLYEYVHALTGPADNYSGWGIIGFAPDDCALGTNPISGDDAPNYFFDAQCGQVIDLPTICFGECDECIGGGLGCTDEAAANYDPNASIDDGSCILCEEPIVVNFSVDVSDVMTAGYDNVLVNGSWDTFGDSNEYWGAWSVILSDEDMDSIYSGSLELGDPGLYEYVHTLTGANDGWSGWGVIGFAPDACALGVNPDSGDESQNFYFTAECGATIDLPTVCFGECDDCSNTTIGCTDPSADNYNPLAIEDDGSCTYCGDFEISIISIHNVTSYGGSDGYIIVTALNGSDNYDFNVYDLNGIQQNPFNLTAGDYVVAVTDMTFDCSVEANFSIYELIIDIAGCTDENAINYNPEAAFDDGSCEYAQNPCDNTPTGLFVDDIIHDRVVFNWSEPSAAPSHYMIRYRVVGTSSWTVMTAGPVNSNAFNGTSRTRYFMQPGTTYEWSMRARVLNEDGSMNCQSDWSADSEYSTLPACSNLENLSASTEANWVTFSADAPDESWGVWQSKGKVRVAGSNSFRYLNGNSNGDIDVHKGNFSPSTDYEWHTKAWCTGNVDANGDSDPQYHSGWGDFSAFTTEAICDKMPTNLSTSSNGANTAITMSWSTPQTGAPDHYFLELTNVTTGQVWAWNNLAGSSTSKTKFGLTAGEYSWKIRGACGTNGTSWATIFSQPVTYTLGGARLALLSNFSVYPNPSSDVFKVSFYSESQTEISVYSILGKQLYYQKFIGNAEFITQIDLSDYAKGLYELKIKTDRGISNHKLIRQ